MGRALLQKNELHPSCNTGTELDIFTSALGSLNAFGALLSELQNKKKKNKKGKKREKIQKCWFPWRQEFCSKI